MSVKVERSGEGGEVLSAAQKHSVRVCVDMSVK